MTIGSWNAFWKDKALFTPGPLTTSRTVKQAMLRDLGSRDQEFIALVADVRRRLVRLADADPDLYTAVLMQGSGTFAIEAVIGSVIPPHGRLLVLVNGAYGERMVQIARRLSIDVVEVRSFENAPVDVNALAATLAQDNAITHVAVVHCETTTGVMNPIDAVGTVTARFGRSLIVDAMSSFGAYPVDLAGWGVDYLISSANKCIEGVPGFAFVLARIAALQATRGYARSISLDLLAQYEGLERDGQFRFTPPVHAILAFHQALVELEAEGGVVGRGARYRRNYETTLRGMMALGFRPYVPEAYRSYIITSFYYPAHPNFDFQRFYHLLSERGCVIYPGKLSHADCFRIGHIGRLEIADVENLLCAVRAALSEMEIQL
uniref:2-aminoethylphosphonate--pyruvate transaminase n=1 Tax=Caldilinea aerophila TaxID=133453 RepID=A0A7C1JGY0_9CHLR